MRYFSMFTGIGGFEYGIQTALPNAECVGYSEIDKYAIKTYERHFKHKNYGDATKIKAETMTRQLHKQQGWKEKFEKVNWKEIYNNMITEEY